MVSTSDFRKGMVLKIDGELFSIVDYQHNKTGRGGAMMKTKLKSLSRGSIVEKTYRSGEKFEEIRIEKRPMQYLYDEGDALVFMDNETYEQISIDKDMAGNILDYIKESDICDVAMNDETPLSIEPPLFVSLEVIYAEPGVRGDTATNVTKPVKVETEAEINVPIFVEQGDVIKIDTRTGDYVERVKK